MSDVDQQIPSLRTKFLQKLEKDGTPDSDGFHPHDISRIKNSDDWLRKFLIENDGDLNNALEMLWDTCVWRKKNDVNDLRESNLRKDYLEHGSVYAHGRDVDGRYLLVFNTKKHVKGQKDLDEIKKCVVYWMERLQRLDKGNPISLFFDMSDSGLANMDMEFTKYIIALFKSYYPEFLNYIIIFEMPWILNAAFKIIKTWLPAKAVQKMKFVNKSSLKEFVPTENALVAWGGTDEYVFNFVPEQRSLVHDKDDNKKKVHFADGSPLNEKSTHVGDASGIFNSAVTVTPSDAINFVLDGQELTGTITLSNKNEEVITYKIKTTSPEKFRVRPSTGILVPSESVTINIVVQPGYYQLPDLLREKFQIMSLPLESVDLTPADLTEFWKQAAGKPVSQLRLKCKTGIATSDSSLRNGSVFNSSSLDLDQQISQLSAKVAQIRDCTSKLSADVKCVRKLQIFSTIVLILLGIFVAFMFNRLQEYSESYSCYRS